MNQQRKICAARLFDAIGDIEDRYIAEAEAAYSSKKRRALLTRLLPVALSFTVLIGVYVAFMMGNMAKTEDNAMMGGAAEDCLSNPDADREIADGGGTVGSTSDQQSPTARLALLLNRTEAPATDEASLTVMDGVPRLVWKQAGEEAFHAVELTATQAEALTEEMAKNAGTPISAPDSVSLRLWIVTADGRVLTPYLSSGEPDSTQSTLFDYAPAMEPSVKLVEQIEGILTPNS